MNIQYVNVVSFVLRIPEIHEVYLTVGLRFF